MEKLLELLEVLQNIVDPRQGTQNRSLWSKSGLLNTYGRMNNHPCGTSYFNTLFSPNHFSEILVAVPSAFISSSAFAGFEATPRCLFNPDPVLLRCQRFLENLVYSLFLGHEVFHHHFIYDHSLYASILQIAQSQHIVREFVDLLHLRVNLVGA